MNYTIALVLLVAGTLLLFGCTGGKLAQKAGKAEADKSQSPSAGQQSASGITESDLLIFEEGDADLPVDELPMDTGS